MYHAHGPIAGSRESTAVILNFSVVVISGLCIHCVCFVLLVWLGKPPLWPPAMVCAGLGKCLNREETYTDIIIWKFSLVVFTIFMLIYFHLLVISFYTILYNFM